MLTRVLKIEIYKTDGGRIVTRCNLPASLVVKARRNDQLGTEISEPMQVPAVPPAPAGPPRVRSRDARGGTPPPRGSNLHDFPFPDQHTYVY